MIIEKKGLIYCPTGKWWWAQTHAYQPTALLFNDKIIVYFASYDKNNRGRIGCAILEADNPSVLRSVCNYPMLGLGEKGTFDCDGVSPSSVIIDGHNLLLYYFGWQRTDAVPFLLFTGIASQNLLLSSPPIFERVSRAPILERSDTERFVRDASYVMKKDGIYKMWYVTAPEIWGERYTVYYIESTNPWVWPKSGVESVKLDSYELGIGRPCVIYEDGKYKMWYSWRGYSSPYKIGYAESEDGIKFERMDNTVKIVGTSEFDSEMMCMPYIVDVEDRRYMFYNGNNIGKSGFGYAEIH